MRLLTALAYLREEGVALVAARLFAIFAAANTLFLVSFLAWWPRPDTAFAQWVLMPLAIALLWAPQFLSYALFDYIETLRQFGPLEAHLTLTTISTITYTPLVMWWRARRDMPYNNGMQLTSGAAGRASRALH